MGLGYRGGGYWGFVRPDSATYTTVMQIDPMGDLNTEAERALGKVVKAKYGTDFYTLHRCGAQQGGLQRGRGGGAAGAGQGRVGQGGSRRAMRSWWRVRVRLVFIVYL